MSDGRMAELRGIHVLVIDDDQLARHFLRSVLEFSGAIVTATRADDAIRAALIADVIVCDLASAEMAGSDFFSELQHLHVRLGQTVPTIALVPTGTRSAGVRAAGFQAYLTKPVDGDELRAAVLEAAASKLRPIEEEKGMRQLIVPSSPSTPSASSRAVGGAPAPSAPDCRG